MDTSKQQPRITAGLDIGDRYSYPFASSTRRVARSSKRVGCALTPRPSEDASEPSLRIAIETGTHSPWVSRLLKECGHEVLVANARKLRLIYSNKQNTDEVDAESCWPAWPASIRSCSTLC